MESIVLALPKILRKYSPAKLEKRGLFSEIEEWSRNHADDGIVFLERHKLSRLYQQDENSISFPFLSSLCEWLIQECQVPAHLLPAMLFDWKEQHLLDLIGKTGHLQFSLGVRYAKDWGSHGYSMGSDIILQSKLEHLITRHLITQTYKPLELEDLVIIEAPPKDIKPKSIPQEWPDRVECATDWFAQMKQTQQTTHVVIGSTKVNCLTELIVAELHDVTPFKTPARDTYATPAKIPFFICFRETDPRPPSCCGGYTPPKEIKGGKPGIYYLDDEGEWSHAACDDKTEDVALLLYHHHIASNQIYLICSGFSSKATQMLTKVLYENIDQFWPPQVKTGKETTGVFVVRFQIEAKADTETKTPLRGMALPEFTFEVVPVNQDAVSTRAIA